MISPAGWFIAYLFRWLSHASPTGLLAIGNPDESSPVVVTANFSLTVRRVRRALRGQDLWLLVANSEGINVWCASAGGLLSANRVIDAIKVSGLAEKVRHRHVILPALSAAGIQRGTIEEQTGFRPHFGPVYAKDVPAYLAAGRRKTEAMCRFRFDLAHRLDMLVPMNFPVYLVAAVVLAVFWPGYLLGATILFWSAVTALYLLVNVLPGKTGWAQAALAASVVVLGWGAFDWATCGDPLRHWGWLIAAMVVFFAAGFDLAGIASPRKSDPEQLMIRLGFKSLGKVFTEKQLGAITLDRAKCKGCGICREICPIGVFGDPDEEGKTTFCNREACFHCGACVRQCPESALELRLTACAAASPRPPARGA